MLISVNISARIRGDVLKSDFGLQHREEKRREEKTVICPLTWKTDEGHVVSLSTCSQEGNLLFGPPPNLHGSKHLLVMGYEDLLVDGWLGTHLWSRQEWTGVAKGLSREGDIHFSLKARKHGKTANYIKQKGWLRLTTQTKVLLCHKSPKSQKTHPFSLSSTGILPSRFKFYFSVFKSMSV